MHKTGRNCPALRATSTRDVNMNITRRPAGPVPSELGDGHRADHVPPTPTPTHSTYPPWRSSVEFSLTTARASHSDAESSDPDCLVFLRQRRQFNDLWYLQFAHRLHNPDPHTSSTWPPNLQSRASALSRSSRTFSRTTRSRAARPRGLERVAGDG